MRISSRLQISLLCATFVGATAAGCFSLEDLSSYSAGTGAPSDATGSVGGTGGSSAGNGSTPPTGGNAPLTDAGAGLGGNDEQVIAPGDVELDPPPMPVATEAESCDAAGEFIGLEPSTCYLLVTELSGWLGARSDCQEWGGGLVEIFTPEENSFLAEEVEGGYWVGASDRQEEGEVVWNSGAPVVFATWATDQPDNFQDQEDCIERREPDGLWNDVPCTSMKPSLCERSD